MTSDRDHGQHGQHGHGSCGIQAEKPPGAADIQADKPS
jgi:hypothetical protein